MKKGLDLLHELNVEKEKVIQIRESIFDRLDYAKYHYHEYIKMSNISKLDSFMLVVSPDKEKERIAIRANILACVQSIHVVYDYLAYLSFIVLGLNLKQNYVNFSNVIDYLKKIENDRYSKYLLILKTAKDSKLYKCICDMVNHSKHKYIIKPKDSLIQKDGELRRETYFIEFTQGNNNHHEIEVNEFIEREYSQITTLINEVGDELFLILK